MERRNVARKIRAHQQLEGGGFPVRRPFPTPGLPYVDPFLLLDHMGPVKWGPGEAIGAPDHPHRGFETVTYLLQGSMFHEDSAGHSGVLEPGDVQWMTAGNGVIHSELPEPRFKEVGGTTEGFQVWVNLPAKDKRMEPRYQEVPREKIPHASSEDGKVHVRVIAGESLGVGAVIDTRVPIHYLHFTIQPGGSHVQPVASGMNAVVYVFRGAVKVADETVVNGEAAILGAGDSIALSVEAEGGEEAQCLLLAGTPLNEPVAQYGPFVMNTKEEIMEAVADYQAGRFTRIQR